MLGLRYGFLQEPLRGWLEDGTLDWLWAAAERASVPIAMLATDSLPAIGRIAERHPGLRLTIDHLGGKGGNTTLKDAAAMTHLPALLALAKHPNVAVKATGAPGYSSEAYPFPAMQTFVRQIYDAFGPQRLFWGTDITKMPCSWRQCVTMFTEELPWLKGTISGGDGRGGVCGGAGTRRGLTHRVVDAEGHIWSAARRPPRPTANEVFTTGCWRRWPGGVDGIHPRAGIERGRSRVEARRCRTGSRSSATSRWPGPEAGIDRRLENQPGHARAALHLPRRTSARAG